MAVTRLPPRARRSTALEPGQLKELYERKARALARRPELARGTGQARLRVERGLRCLLESGAHVVAIDLPVADGGEGSGLPPADLVRAGLAASLAMGFKLWAARLDVPIDAVEVEVHSDFDARGALLPGGDVTVGWQRLLLEISVVSAAPAEAIASIRDLALAHCPLLAILSPAIERRCELRQLPPG